MLVQSLKTAQEDIFGNPLIVLNPTFENFEDLVPPYQVVLGLHLDDNILALVLIYPTLALPFCVWILSAYFQHLPREVEESALVEGASRTTAFFRIILPMSRPVVIAAGIFALGTIASDFTLASVFLLSEHNQP